MKLTFLGTKACIDIHNRRHRRHSSLMIEHLGPVIMIDCGADWKVDGKLSTRTRLS